MGFPTFWGGVHPPQNKDLTRDKRIEPYLPKSDLAFPMSQHIGAPNAPVVARGDKVKVGTPLGSADAFVSAPVLSSVSGTVKDVGPRQTVPGTFDTCVVVENDGLYEKDERWAPLPDYENCDPKEYLKRIREAGIVGFGGATFPAAVKFAPPPQDKIKWFIVNGAECEPYLNCDFRLMMESTDEIVKGTALLLRLFPEAEGVIAVENNKPEAIKILTELVKDEPRITVCPLLTKYPQGGERSLIYAVTGRKVNSSMLPADAGCIVDNVSTVIAIYRAVCKQTPLITRVVTLTGEAFNTPINVDVRIGCSHAELVEEGDGFKEEPKKIISGGPMMGFAMFDLNVPVTKTSSSILAMTKDEVAENEPTPCIRCGRCVEACPGNLVPQKMAEAAMNKDYDTFVKLNGMECYECGSCTYVCPAKRPLTQSFKQARQYVAAQRRKK